MTKNQYVYTKEHLDNIPDGIIERYKLTMIADNRGDVLIEIRRGMYGLTISGKFPMNYSFFILSHTDTAHAASQPGYGPITVAQSDSRYASTIWELNTSAKSMLSSCSKHYRHDTPSQRTELALFSWGSNSIGTTRLTPLIYL